MVCFTFNVLLCVLQNTQRISSSQSTQPLATPVVSVTTPSLPPQGLMYSGMPTTYNPAGECRLGETLFAVGRGFLQSRQRGS